MPNYNATGPLGYGPGTGRGLGPCGDGIALGKRAGRGYGRGFGWRRFYTKKEESDILKEESNVLEEELKAVKERLSELKKT